MWLDKNPDDRWKAVNGSTGNEDTVSWASDKWFKDNNGYDALGILSKIIDYINSDPYYAARVVGYHPCVGEWFEPYCREKGADASVTNTKKFRAWLKDKYKTDAALKAAWADGTATLASAAVPDVPGNGGRTETRSLLTEKSDTRTIDFYEYTQWLVASRIKEFNKLVKQKTNNRCLTVAFYGYEMEVVTPLSGHNAVEALLQDKNMDALVSPISYHDRNEGGLGGFMSPVDAVQSAGKLWIVEDDIRLLNNPDDPDASYNPAAGQRRRRAGDSQAGDGRAAHPWSGHLVHGFVGKRLAGSSGYLEEHRQPVSAVHQLYGQNDGIQRGQDGVPAAGGGDSRRGRQLSLRHADENRV